MKMKKIFVAAFSFSLLLNVILVSALLYSVLQGCAELPDGRVGVLTRDIEVGRFSETETVFTLPRGLVVREASATGVDWFEPYRFRLVVTTDDDSLVDYSPHAANPADYGEYYSADVNSRRAQEMEFLEGSEDDR